MVSTHPFRTAVEARDLDAMVALLTDDVVFHSPVTFHPIVGKRPVSRLLGFLLHEVFEDFSYTDELTAGDGTTVLVFTAMVGERSVQGIDLLRHDADGRIADFTVMVRPMSGLGELAARVGARYDEIVGS